MKKLTILVDADDTIEYLLKAWMAILNERYNTSVQVSDITSWNLQDAFPSLTKEEVYAPLREDSIWDKVEPNRYAIHYIRKLIEDGHDVYIVTATHYSTYKAKMEKVLLRHFPIRPENVIVAYNKGMIRGDVRVDDAVHNLEGYDGVKILIDAPHNRDYNARAHGVHRVSWWGDVYKIICRVAAGEDEWGC